MRCGIDFGTSNTTMAVMCPQRGAYLVPLEDAHTTIPTALFFPGDKHHPVLFGRAAMRAYMAGEEGRLMRSIKRILGTALMDQKTVIRGRPWAFTDIIRQFFEHIKNEAETAVGQRVTDVTIGRPVHFQNNNPSADRAAQETLRTIAVHAGFETVAFRYEPIAAALAHERHIAQEKLALVVDIGGGTSDFSVIRLCAEYAHDPKRDRSKDILANHGTRIGGNDCDRAINLDVAMPLLGMHTLYGDKQLEMPHKMYYDLSEWSRVNQSYTPLAKRQVEALQREAHEPEKIQRLQYVLDEQLGHHVLDVSEQIKITLTERDTFDADYGFIETGLHRTVIREAVDVLMENTLHCVQGTMMETVRMAQIAPQDIAAVILTGGTTGLPLFRRWLQQAMPQADILDENRLDSVGLGLVL